MAYRLHGLVRYENRSGIRRFGALKGQFVVDDSFFDPLPEAELIAWDLVR